MCNFIFFFKSQISLGKFLFISLKSLGIICWKFNFNNYFSRIEKYIKQGNSVSIIRHPVNHNGKSWIEWNLKANTILFGRLAKAPFTDVVQKAINGFSVSGIYRYTFQDTLEYDKTHFDNNGNNTTYAENWCKNARDKGYIYLIEFSGYGTVN